MPQKARKDAVGRPPAVYNRTKRFAVTIACPLPALLCGIFTKKERLCASPDSASLAEAVATSAMLAVAGVADVDRIEFTVHAVRVIQTIRNAAGHAAVYIMRHTLPPFFLFFTFLKKIFPRD